MDGRANSHHRSALALNQSIQVSNKHPVVEVNGLAFDR